jgi:hypothetical protein
MMIAKHDLSIRFKQAYGIEVREVEDELFLAAPGPGTIHHLNRMASAVWRTLVEPRTTEDLIALFQAAFPEVPRRKIAKDMRSVLKFLVDTKLIVRTELRPPPQKRRVRAR